MDRELADGFEISRLTRDFLDDPFPTYHALRRHAPAKRMEDGSVFLTRYADVTEVYHDAGRYSSDKTVDFRPAMGDTLALRAPHDQPGLQRRALPHQGPQAVDARLHAARA